MTPSEYVAALDRCGWFIGLPDAARADTMAGVTDAMSGGFEPWVNLGIPMGDDEADDPAAALALLAEAAFGLFQASAIEVKPVGRGFTVDFRVEGQLEAVEWPDGGVGWDNLMPVANRIVSVATPGLRFLQIADEESSSLVLTNATAFKKAQELGLIPQMPGEGDERE